MEDVFFLFEWKMFSVSYIKKDRELDVRLNVVVTLRRLVSRWTQMSVFQSKWVNNQTRVA